MKTAIVVGGGLAGVAAALALAKNGVKVQLLEARRRLGGRTGSFTHPDCDEAVDYCQHVGMGCCTNLRQLIDWLGQPEHWETQRSLHFYGPDGNYQHLAALPLLPAPLHLAGWLWRWPGLTFADRFAVARGMLAMRKLNISRETDSQAAEAWLVAHHQTQAAIDHFWRTIIVSALGEELSQVNLSSVAKVLQDGFLNHRDAFHLLIPKRPLGELFGTLAEQKLREHGVMVQLQTPVQRLVQNTEDVFSVQTEHLGTLQADAIIVAVPWFRMRSLVESTGHQLLMNIGQNAARIATSPISGIHTWWDRPWLDTPHAAIVGRMCQWVFPKHNDASAETASNGQHYYQIVVSASRQLPRGYCAELMRLVELDLAAVFPKVRDAKLLRMQAVTDPQAVFSIGVNCNALRPRTDVSGTNVWLAGDWIQTGWPATMEGAILSGWSATENILASWGTPVRIAALPLSRSL
jgi:squalene-associated FAD-dependent desaturase